MNGFQYIVEQLNTFFDHTAFANFTGGHIVMLLVGLLFIFLAVKREYQPLILIPVGFGIIIGNIPFIPGLEMGIHDEGSILNVLHHGVRNGWYPPLIFLGIGAMTDFSALIATPRLILIGIAAQFGIFGAYVAALQLGFVPAEAGAIGIIGGADGPTAIFLASKLAPDLLSAIAISAYAFMALAPVIQPPFMRLFTTKKERVIKMKPLRQVTKTEKILFPVIGILLTCLIVPGGLPLLAMLFFGNLLKESGVTKRLATTAGGTMIDIVTILIGLTVGASAQATTFLTSKTMNIFVLGIAAFVVATIAGVLFVKLMNLFLKNKINPLIGSAGVAALPEGARVSNIVGQEYDKNNFLLTHAMGPNVAGVIGSAIAAGILLSFLY
jgi:oxaloacetate decarboxylase beta subunit